MLILENLAFQTAKKSFLNSSRKLIKFQINQSVHKVKNPAKVKNQSLVQWTEPISLPLLPNETYRFQIYEMHQFGYNPEQLNAVAIGKFTIDSDEAFSTWEVSTEKGNKIGFLSAKIRRKLRYAPNASTARPQAEVLEISSIIAHISSLKQKRGYVVVTVMGRPYRTEISKSKSGELLFTDVLDIQKTDEIIDAKIEVFSYDAKDEKSELLGSGTVNLDSEHPQRKATLKNDKNMDVGDVYLDYKIFKKESFAASKELAKIIQKKTRIDSSRIDPMANLSASKTLNASKLYENTLLHRSLKKSQRVSVVNHNTKIFIPTEERFKQYTDSQNRNVSYLRDRDHMEFKDFYTKSYIKGASIGKGNKLDFTNLHKSNPGVGVYNLPSIWDRY